MIFLKNVDPNTIAQIHIKEKERFRSENLNMYTLYKKFFCYFITLNVKNFLTIAPDDVKLYCSISDFILLHIVKQQTISLTRVITS